MAWPPWRAAWPRFSDTRCRCSSHGGCECAQPTIKTPLTTSWSIAAAATNERAPAGTRCSRPETSPNRRYTVPLCRRRWIAAASSSCATGAAALSTLLPARNAHRACAPSKHPHARFDGSQTSPQPIERLERGVGGRRRCTQEHIGQPHDGSPDITVWRQDLQYAGVGGTSIRPPLLPGGRTDGARGQAARDDVFGRSPPGKPYDARESFHVRLEFTISAFHDDSCFHGVESQSVRRHVVQPTSLCSSRFQNR